MKVAEVEPIHGEYVTLTNHSQYRRSFHGSWEELMGNSWEPCYSQERELEKVYQEFKTKLQGEKR